MNMVSCQWDIGFGSQNTILLSLERITCQSWDFFFFFTILNLVFVFFKNKPDIDVLDSKNYVAFWTDLESIRFCILNNLFPSITWLCAYCIQVWIIALYQGGAVIILCTSFKIIMSLLDMSSFTFKILFGSQDFIKQIKINFHKYKKKSQLWQN